MGWRDGTPLDDRQGSGAAVAEMPRWQQGTAIGPPPLPAFDPNEPTGKSITIPSDFTLPNTRPGAVGTDFGVMQSVQKPEPDKPISLDQARGRAIDTAAFEEARKIVSGESAPRIFKKAEYEQFADAVAKRLGKQSTPEFVQGIAQYLDTYETAKRIQREGPGREAWGLHAGGGDDGGALLEAVARLNQADRPHEQEGIASRTGQLAVQKLGDVGFDVAKLAAGGLTDREKYAQQLEQVRRTTDPLILPDQGFASRNLMGLVSELPKIGLTMATGGGGAALAYGIPSGVESQERASAAGAGKWQSLAAGVGAGIVDTYLFAGVSSGLKKQFSGEISKSLEESLAKYITESQSTGMKLSASAAKSELLHSAALATSGKDAELGKALYNTLANLPDAAFQALLLHAPGAAVSLAGKISSENRAPSRAEAKQLGMTPEEAKSKESRQAAMQAIIDKAKPPASEPQTPPAEPPPAQPQQEQANAPENVQEAKTAQPAENVQENEAAPPAAAEENVGQQADAVQPDGRVEPAAESPQAPPEAPSQAPPEDAATIGIKNRIMDATRAADRGLESPDRTPAQSKQQMLDEATAKMKAEPAWIDSVIGELDNKPRNLSPLEIAGMQVRYLDLNNRFGAAVDKQAAARAAGDEPALDAATTQTNLIAEQLGKFEGTVQSGKSEWGRAGNALQIELLRDGSMANLKRQRVAARAGEKLDPEDEAKENEELAAMSKKILDLEGQLKSHLAEAADKEMHAKLDAQIAADKAEVQQKPVVKPKAKIRQETARKAVDDALAEYRDITKKNQGIYVGSTKIVPEILLDPERLAAAVKVVKAYVDLGVATLTEVWADAKQKMGLTDEDYPLFVGAWRQEREAGNVPSPISDPRDFDEVSRFARQVQRAVVDAGERDREKVVDKVHEELQKIIPDISRRDTKLAISRYGKFRELPKDPTSVKVREINGELQQLLKLEDMQGGHAPLKTGVEGREPSDEERRLIKEVNEKKKEGGYTVIDPAKALKTALGSAKTAVRNRIADLNKEITTRQKIVSERKPLEPDQELLDLRKQRDELQAAHDEIFSNKGSKQTKEQQVAAAAGRALDRAIESLASDLAKNKVSPNPKVQSPQSPELDAKRARLAALRAQRDELRLYDPEYQAAQWAKKEALKSKRADVREIEKGLAENDAEARQTAAYKRNLTKRLADLMQVNAKNQERVKKPVKKTVIDKQAADLKYRLELEWDKHRSIVAKNRAENRTKTEKALDLAGKFRVAGVLSNITVFAKLAGAAAARSVTMPAEEAVGGGLSKLPLVRKIAEKAPSEGGSNMRAYIKSLLQAFTAEDFKQTWQTLKTGKGKIDVLYGTPHAEARGLLDLFGQMHAAMKSPVKRMAFRADFEKRLAWYEKQTDPLTKQPVDTNDPLVQMRIAAESYKNAERSIFMQDNRLTSWLRMGIRAKIDPATGHAGVGQKAKELAGRVALPVLNIPMNIVKETLTYSLGLASGGGAILAKLHEAGWSPDKMIENLKPDEADMIMRHLKKGSIGGAFLLLGYFNPQSIGGYYQQGKKRKDDDVQYGGIKLFGVEMPRLLLHNPLLETLQIGSTIRRVSDSYAHKKDAETQGVGEGIKAAAFGLADETPFMRQITDITKIKEGREGIKDYATDVLVPGGVKQAYNYFNPPPKKPLRPSHAGK